MNNREINMTDEEYFAYPAVSQSAIKDFIKSRKLYEYNHVLGLGSGVSTSATDLGSLNHCLLFEPTEFHNRYAHFDGVQPSSANMHKFIAMVTDESSSMTIEDMYCNCYSTKGKKPEQIQREADKLLHELLPYINFNKEHGHKILITESDELLSRRMIEIVMNHEGVRKTLVRGRNNPEFEVYYELVIIWDVPFFTKKKLKSKVDELHVDVKNQIAYAYDYKTTRTPNIQGFKSSIRYYGYDVQESFYSEAIKYYLRKVYGLDFQVIFRFIPQLNTAPYNVLDVIELDDADREEAYLKWSEALKELQICYDTGQFDNPAAYSESGINKIRLSENSIVEEGTDY